MAMSPIFLDRRIGLMNTSDRALSVFFQRRSNFSGINPRSMSSLSFLKRTFKLYRNQPAIKGLINGPAWLLLGRISQTWALLGRNWPDNVFLFLFEFILYLKRLEFCKGHNKINKKNTKPSLLNSTQLPLHYKHIRASLRDLSVKSDLPSKTKKIRPTGSLDRFLF
jgi:hypothetical protein